MKTAAEYNRLLALDYLYDTLPSRQTRVSLWTRFLTFLGAR